MEFPEGYAVAVTGAASGIGRAVAVYLAARGVRVALLDRDDPAEAAAEAGNGATSHVLDITDAAACRSVLGGIIENFGRLDGLVLNVGISKALPLARQSAADWDEEYAVNIRSHMLIARAALPFPAAPQIHGCWVPGGALE